MNNRLSEIREQLHAIRNLCLQEVEELRERLIAAESELLQLHDVFAAIDGKAQGQRATKPAKPGKRRPSPTKEEVLAAVRETLASKGTASGDQLKRLAGDKLRNGGKSLAMYGAIFAKCLGDPSLREGPAGHYSLAAADGEATDRSDTDESDTDGIDPSVSARAKPR
jgi:hypothetical protein